MGTPADAAYARVREIGLGFPAAEEKLSHGMPSFHVRGKMFLHFIDQHHGDPRIAVWCKSTLEEQQRLVADSPERFFVPPYVGVKGWVGVCVDEAHADWIELSILVEEAWRAIAPPRIVRGEEVPVRKPIPRASPRVKTDPKRSAAARRKLTAACEALPEAVTEDDGRYATYRVGKKAFAYFLDNHHGDGAIAACVKSDRRAAAALVRKEPERFFIPQYMGAHGWVGVRLDTARVDWKDVAARVAASYRAVAPRRLLAAL